MSLVFEPKMSHGQDNAKGNSEKRKRVRKPSKKLDDASSPSGGHKNNKNKKAKHTLGDGEEPNKQQNNQVLKRKREGEATKKGRPLANPKKPRLEEDDNAESDPSDDNGLVVAPEEAQGAAFTSCINFDLYDNVEVECSAKDIVPIDMFENCQALGDSVLNNIKRNDYKKPTPVQKYALPILLQGKDLMACAQTGSGKTAAFLLPIIAGLLSEDKRKGQPSGVGWRHTYRSYPLVVILAPTRELASQIYDEAVKFTLGTKLQCRVVYGGTKYVDQARTLEKGCDILVATPGRLKDMLDREKVFLMQVCYVVLDEADRMLDMGFEPQIRHIVEATDMPKDRQMIMFSATFAKPIRTLAEDFLSKNYTRLTVGRVGSTTEFITQKIKYVEGHKEVMLKKELESITDSDRVLVFVGTKKGAAKIAHFLTKGGVNAGAIHGDLLQHERERALRSFRSGRSKVLVGTSVAARGLDIDNVTHVINYDMPHQIDDYVHRIGRTGRAGNKGVATAFFTDDDGPLARELFVLLKESNQEIPPWLYSLSQQRFSARKPAQKRWGGGGNRRWGGGGNNRRDSPRGQGQRPRSGSFGGAQKKGSWNKR